MSEDTALKRQGDVVSRRETVESKGKPLTQLRLLLGILGWLLLLALTIYVFASLYPLINELNKAIHELGGTVGDTCK
jgi:hypothetical protein